MVTFYIAIRNYDFLHWKEGGPWRHNSLFSKPGFISESSRSSKSWLMTDDDDVDIVGEAWSSLLSDRFHCWRTNACTVLRQSLWIWGWGWWTLKILIYNRIPKVEVCLWNIRRCCLLKQGEWLQNAEGGEHLNVLNVFLDKTCIGRIPLVAISA